MKPWTKDHIRKLRRWYPKLTNRDIAKRLRRTLPSVDNMAHILVLRKPLSFLEAHRYQKGLQPWNKGTHWKAGGRSVATRFPKGHMPHNWKPVGTVRINSEGYMDIKITDLRRGALDWRAIHRLNWIAERGPIPEGYFLRFKDGDQLNPLVENLELVTRADHMRRNTYHRYPKEIALLIQLRGALQRQINRREGKHG